MIFRKNNFLRFFIGLYILLLSLITESKELNYEFHWLYVPVAKLSINFNNSFSINNKINNSHINFNLATQGPLKLYRNYKAEGYIKRRDINSWDYYLNGYDRGHPEEKLITYFINKMPKIRKFIDDTDAIPIKINYLDKGAIDPFSILIKMMEQLTNEKKCNHNYHIMDGKRRYKVKIKFVGEEYLNKRKKNNYRGETLRCQLILSSSFEVLSEKKLNNIWPFNGKNKIVDIWFAKNEEFKPVKFEFIAPIGRLVGRVNNL